jgi:hypothetical protein
MPVILPGVTGYDDGRVACTDDELIIRHYYLAGAKHIGYQEIHEARQVPLGRWAGGASTAAELARHGVNVTTGQEAGLYEAASAAQPDVS